MAYWIKCLSWMLNHCNDKGFLCHKEITNRKCGTFGLKTKNLAKNHLQFKSAI